MNRLIKLAVVGSFLLSIVAGWAGTQEPAIVEQPTAKTTEPWEIKVQAPGWLTNVSGFTGFHGVNPYVNVGFGQLLKLASAGKTWFQEWVWACSNLSADCPVRIELSKGRVVGWIC